LKIAEENPERIYKIDARKSFEVVLQTSYRAIVEQYPQFFEN
ncbi:dTMP kinase, partial [Escherichia coli]|nr:dTMP kinase [Escherichia coli]